MNDSLQALLRDRDRWEQIARREPYHAVLSQPQYLRGDDPRVRAAFFETGESSVDEVLSRVISLAAGPHIRTVLEYGCGPGRLAIPFARRGFTVTAVDISATMLALARRNAEERNVSGITFQRVEEFAAGAETYDLVNATIVLQQLAPRDGSVLLRQLAARVAPGGRLHVQLPFRTDRGAASRAVLALRRHVPAVNAAFNVLRKRAAGVAVLAPHIYSMDDVLLILRDAALDIERLEVSQQNELHIATIVARRSVANEAPKKQVEQEPVSVPDAKIDADFIDVRELIRSTSIEELNRRAEQYFATAPSFEAQLAKPFSTPADAPAMLISLGAMLKGMHLVQGHVVLDFGCGTGWLSRRLTEMGSRMILADVSETALRIAREHMESLGLMKGGFPRFLHYDGQTIDLPAMSVDRIVCFDSFHHVPNPETVLREFGRILKPGGIAAFSEPGPNHSRSPQSQFEMRSFSVIENDIDIDAIWGQAREAGFSGIELAVYTADPLQLPLERFREIFRGGEALAEAAHATRRFLEDTRLFFLNKEGREVLDSRNVDAVACSLDAALIGEPNANEPLPVRVTVVNRGKAIWLPSPVDPGGVWLGCHLYANGELADLNFHWQSISDANEIEPGQSVTLEFTLPPLAPGTYDLEFDCVAKNVTWFAQAGSTPARISVRLR